MPEGSIGAWGAVDALGLYSLRSRGVWGFGFFGRWGLRNLSGALQKAFGALRPLGSLEWIWGS